jgi:hypothetical protein
MTVVVNDTSSKSVVFPNPAPNGTFKINWKNLKVPADKQVQVAVYDRLGRVVYKKDYLNSSNNNWITDVDIRSVSNGLYFIRLQTKDKSIKYSTKIIKGGN